MSANGIRIAGIAVLAVATIVGACQLAFSCDDAFIAFRYIGNAHDGHGLVWNKPPFLPVEGYSCFLWALLLWGTWSVTGLEPPATANGWSIAFGVVQFALVAAAAMRLRHRDGRRAGDVVVLATLAVVVGNRTFLQWMTSGLETALFNVACIGWVLHAFRGAAERTTRWLVAWSAFAAIAALTRPDGLLLVAATLAAITLLAIRRERSFVTASLGATPLLAVAAHVVWRRSFYGEWLPNTYYAKVGEPWPEAGWRYAACFVVEHGTWVLLPVALAWVVVELRRGGSAATHVLATNLPATIAVATTVAGAGYYVLRVGGDHFEYRVFSHLVPLSALALAAMVLRFGNGAWPATCAVLGLGIASTFGWLQLALTEPVQPPGYSAMAPRVPGWTRPLVRVYDRWQAWLAVQFVCHRCPQHAASLLAIEQALPPRTRLAADPADLPVLDVVTAGAPAWRLPDVNIVDAHGLNDWVTARWPVRKWQTPELAAAARLIRATGDRDHDGVVTRTELGQTIGDASNADLILVLFARDHEDSLTTSELAEFERFATGIRVMAHERAVPIEYRDAFRPNVTIDGPAGHRRVAVHPRAEPLGPDRVREIERDWRERVRIERENRR